MRSIFLLLILVFTKNIYAFDDNCQFDIFNDENGLLKCKIAVSTPSYSVSYVLRINAGFSEADCESFCECSTLMPVLGGERVLTVPRSLVDRVSRVMPVLLLQQSPEQSPEMVLRTLLSSMLADIRRGEGRFTGSIRSTTIHQRDETQTLSNRSYKVLTMDDLSDDDKNLEHDNALKCSICLEAIVSQILKGNKVVQVNCTSSEKDGSGAIKETCGNHVFCMECIKESYKYQQICPTCRGAISPIRTSLTD